MLKKIKQIFCNHHYVEMEYTRHGKIHYPRYTEHTDFYNNKCNKCGKVKEFPGRTYFPTVIHRIDEFLEDNDLLHNTNERLDELIKVVRDKIHDLLDRRFNGKEIDENELDNARQTLRNLIFVRNNWDNKLKNDPNRYLKNMIKEVDKLD